MLAAAIGKAHPPGHTGAVEDMETGILWLGRYESRYVIGTESAKEAGDR